MDKDIEILRSGDGFVIIKKPIGADSEDKGEGSVPSLVREALSLEYAQPCHRLDKAVGGCMLVATDKRTAAIVSSAVSGGALQKEYLCVCEGAFGEDERQGEMRDLLFFDRSKQKSFVSKKARRSVKEALLDYEVLEGRIEGSRTLSLVRVKLHTGRTHQIRVQFASRRRPLLGDGKYGSHDNKCTVALHSYALTYGEERTECLPDVNLYPWKLFDLTK